MNLPATTRWMAAAAAAVLFLSACTGLSPSSSPTSPAGTALPSPATPTAQVPSATPVPTAHAVLTQDPTVLKGVKLTFMHPWSGPAAAAIERITDEFNQQNIWGYRVRLTAAGSAGEEFNLVNKAIADGQAPQIVAAAPEHVAAWTQQKPGAVLDLAPFVQDKEWGMKPEEISDYNPTIWNQTIIDGRQEGVPAERSLEVLVYNRSWAQELGFSDLPAAPQAFQEQMCAATHANLTDANRDNNGLGGYILTTDPSEQVAWMAAYGLDLSTLSDQNGYTFEGEAAEASFTYLRGLFDKTCAWLARNPQPFDYFAHRQTLAYAAGMTDLPEQELAMQLAENGDDWTVLPFPGPDGKSVTLQSGLNYAILDSNPPEELAAWVFLRWLMLPRNQAQMVEASSSLPLSKSAVDELTAYGEAHPQWLAAAALQGQSVPAPAQPQWRKVKNVVEDAAWQLIQPTLQPIPDILKQLDETIPEVTR